VTGAPGSGASGAARGKLAFALSGGGARAAYQTGVLSYVGRRLPELRVPLLTGVSAGAINVGFLAAYSGNLRGATRALKRRWLSLTTEEVLRTNPASLFKVGLRLGGSLLGGGTGLSPRFRSLVDTSPLREFIERAAPRGQLGPRIRAGDLEAVGPTALSYQTGRTALSVQGAPRPAPSPARSTARIKDASSASGPAYRTSSRIELLKTDDPEHA